VCGVLQVVSSCKNLPLHAIGRFLNVMNSIQNLQDFYRRRQDPFQGGHLGRSPRVGGAENGWIDVKHLHLTFGMNSRRQSRREYYASARLTRTEHTALSRTRTMQTCF
jgi:hypothetical protein